MIFQLYHNIYSSSKQLVNKLRKVAGIDDFSTLSQYLYLK